MNLILLGTGLALVPCALVLDEASAWFRRKALDLRHEENSVEAESLARSARQSSLLSRLLFAISIGVWVAAAAGTGSLLPMAGVVSVVLLWVLFRAVFTGLRWRNPLGLAGRFLFRGLSRVGLVLRWILLFWGQVAVSGRLQTAGERVKELDQEQRWLFGRSGEDVHGKMLTTLQEFGESLVEDVMVRREEMAAVSADSSVGDILSVVKDEGYSRYPVYRDSLDTIVGVLHVFDLLDAPLDAVASSLARPPLLTNDTKPVGTLLRELQATYNQMAVVVDEYGGIAGVVTVEDLLEELVGEIEDEHDESEMTLRRLEPGVYWVDATMRVDDLNEALELELEEGEYDTIAGLMLERLERIPRTGERLLESGTWLEVATAEPHRINAVRVILADRNGRHAPTTRGKKS